MSIESCQAVCHNHDHGHQCRLLELKHDKRKQNQLSKLDNFAVMEKTELQGAMTSECNWAADFWLGASPYQIGLVSKLSHNNAIQRPGKRIDVVAAQQHKTYKTLTAADWGCTARTSSVLPMTLPVQSQFNAGLV